MNRSPSAAVATPVSTKDPVAMASPARFSANVRETMPGLQATKDPNAVTAMKSVTATENPGAKKSTGEASSKVITNSSEFSTVKTPTGSPKKDRESPRNTSKMISSSSEFSTVKTTSGSPEKDRESPMNPVAPDLVSKHSKKASKKAGRNEIQSASFKTEAAAVNGDDTENSPRVDLSYKTTAGPEVLNKKKPTLPSRQQLICFVPQPSAQRPAGNKIEPELETALCSPDKQKTSRLQVKVTLYPERKITFADAGSQKEQEQIEWEKTASPSRSRVRPSSIPPRANDRSNMEKYRTLQRSENFATSTTEEVASHGSPTASQVLSAANPVNVSSPRKSKSPLDVPRMNVENVYPMKQIETCKQVDEAADQKKDFPGANKLGIEKMLEGTKKNEVCKQVVFSDTKVGCVRSQSKLTELKKLMFEKKNAINVKSVAKTKTQPDETSVLVDLVQTMDTQEEIKSDADEWKAFLSKETDRPKAPTDVGKQMAPKTSPKTSLNTSPKMSTKTSPKLSPKMSLKTSPKMSPLVSPKISLKTPLNASPKISLKASPKTSLETTPIASPENITNDVIEYVTKDITEVITEGVTENITKGITDNVTEDITDNVIECATKDTTENVTDCITEDITANITKDIIDSVTENITDSITKDRTEDLTNFVTEDITDSVTKNITEDITEVITKGVTEDVNDGTIENITDGVTKDIIDNVTEGINKDIVEYIT